MLTVRNYTTWRRSSRAFLRRGSLQLHLVRLCKDRSLMKLCSITVPSIFRGRRCEDLGKWHFKMPPLLPSCETPCVFKLYRSRVWSLLEALADVHLHSCIMNLPRHNHSTSARPRDITPSVVNLDGESNIVSIPRMHQSISSKGRDLGYHHSLMSVLLIFHTGEIISHCQLLITPCINPGIDLIALVHRDDLQWGIPHPLSFSLS